MLAFFLSAALLAAPFAAQETAASLYTRALDDGRRRICGRHPEAGKGHHAEADMDALRARLDLQRAGALRPAVIRFGLLYDLKNGRICRTGMDARNWNASMRRSPRRQSAARSDGAETPAIWRVQREKSFPGCRDRDKILSIKPDYVDAGNELGYAYLQMKEYQNCVDALLRTLKVKPDYAVARLNLGFAYFRMGNRAAAIEQYAELMRIDPERAKTLLSEIGAP